jgi:hypothetical protein
VPGNIGLALIISPDPEELADGKPQPRSLKPKIGQYHARAGTIAEVTAAIHTTVNVNTLARLIVPAQA